MAFFGKEEMFRVAEFKKIKGKQVFTQFAFKGYKLDQSGNLTHYKKKINQKDRRKKNFVELNMWTGQKDIKGKPLYAEDFVFDHNNKVNGIIKWFNNMGGFILRVDAGKIEIPYSYLNEDDVKLEYWGNRYENEGRKNKWKK